MAYKTKNVEESKAVETVEPIRETRPVIKAIPVVQGKMVTVAWKNRIYVHSLLHQGIETLPADHVALKEKSSSIIVG